MGAHLTDKFKTQIENFALNLRKNILYMAKIGGSNSAHIGGALSLVDIFSVLFSKFFNFSKNNLSNDRLILSKGHACLALYSLLYEKKNN